MIILSQTTDILEVVLGGTVTTNQARCMTSWRDITTTTFAPDRTVINTNNSTPVNVVGSPAASTQRVIDLVNVYNLDTVTQTVTIQFNANGTRYVLWSGTVGTGESVVYQEGSGWQRLTATGAIITSLGTVTVPYGGTGITSYTVGDLLYANTTTTLAKLADVATGSVLISGGVGVAPSWSQTTGITGVGALTTGSIGSGFGSINVGANSIAGGAISGTTGTFSDNLTLSGSGKFVLADWSSAISTRMMFKTSTVNGNTFLGLKPDGTGTSGGINIFGLSDVVTNTFRLGLTADSGNAGIINVLAQGTSAVRPLWLQIQSLTVATFDTSGGNGAWGQTTPAQGSFTTLGATGSITSTGAAINLTPAAGTDALLTVQSAYVVSEQHIGQINIRGSASGGSYASRLRLVNDYTGNTGQIDISYAGESLYLDIPSAATSTILSSGGLSVSGWLRASVYIRSGSSTVSGLPTAADAGGGAIVYVTDATATTRQSIVAGGGSNKVLVYSDATNWLIV